MSPAAMTARRACDCLDRCGDDPRLARGKVDRCPDSVLRERLQQETVERFTLARELALKGALSIVRAEAAPITTPDGGRWLSLDDGDPERAADLHRAGRYLLLMRHAEAHPTRAHLLRLVGPASTPGPQAPISQPTKEPHA